jgi:hypothetical protein
VRLLKSVLMRLKNTKKPQQKFLCHVMRLMLLVPGRVTFRNLSRYSPYHEKTFARWFERDVDFVSLNHAAIVEVVTPSHEHVLAFDPNFVPKSGKRTPGLDMFWNGAHSRAEKGIEIATLAWIDVTYNSAYTLSVEQTSPAPHSGTEETRIDTYLAHIEHVVTTQQLHALKYLVADGYFSKQKFVDGICALEMHLISKLRHDAHLRHLYEGPRSTGPGRPKTYDGKVSYHDLSRFEHVDTDDKDIALYHQVVNHPHLKRHLRLVVVQHFSTGRYALLFSTDVTLSAQAIYRYYKARFQIEFLFRDAKQFTGLSDCQARSANKLRFHFNASLSAVSFAKLEARQPTDHPGAPFSMASLKRRYFNQHLMDRILDHLATEGRLDKSSPTYAELCNYGTIDDMAA